MDGNSVVVGRWLVRSDVGWRLGAGLNLLPLLFGDQAFALGGYLERVSGTLALDQ